MQAGHVKTEQLRRLINEEQYYRAIKFSLKLDKNDQAKAMQAYCLERVGKRDAALLICDALPKADDRVLVWINAVYSRARKHDSSANMYREMFRNVPERDRERFRNVGFTFFESLCKTYEFGECQTLVMRLIKADAGLDVDLLFAWVAAFAFLRVGDGMVGCDENDKGLVMCEMLLNKAGKKYTDATAFKRWVLIKRGKAKEALDTLQFPLTDSAGSKLWTKALFLRLNERPVVEEFEVLVESVERADRDDVRVFARLAKLAARSSELETRFREVVGRLAGQYPKLRGPSIAMVSIEFEKLLVEESTHTADALTNAMLSHLQKFENLPCGALDLQNYLALFGAGTSSLAPSTSPAASAVGDVMPVLGAICPYFIPIRMFVDLDRENRRYPYDDLVPVSSFLKSTDCPKRFLACLKEHSQTKPRPIYFQALRAAGGFENNTKAEHVAMALTLTTLGLKSSAPEQIDDADDYSVLVYQSFVSAANCDDATTQEKELYYLKAALLLEKRLKASPDSFQIKLALHELYSFRLGASRPGLEAFQLLKVKQTQLEALGYLLLSDLSSCGLFHEANDAAKSICEFNSRARAETAESFAESFPHIANTSPVELYRLELRLRDSLQASVARVERAQASMLACFSPVPALVSSKKKTAEDDDDSAIDPPAKLFQRIRVEIEDPPIGSSHVTLPEDRLAIVATQIEQDLSKLCLNSDFDPITGYEPAFSKLAKHHTEHVAVKSGLCARIPRECVGSRSFSKACRDRTETWVKLRVISTKLLHVLHVGGGSLAAELLEQIRSLVSMLGFTKEGDDWWRVGLSCLERAIVEKDDYKALESETIPLLEELLKKSNTAEQMSASLRATPREFFEHYSLDLSTGMFWVAAVVVYFSNSVLKKNAKIPARISLEGVARLKKFREVAVKAFLGMGQNLGKVFHELSASTKQVVGDHVQDADENEELAQIVKVKVNASYKEQLQRLSKLALAYSAPADR